MSKFYGISVGPGDQGLLTLRAVEVLGLLDILLIPNTQGEKKGVAEIIAEKYVKEGVIKHYVHFPMVKDEEVFETIGMTTATFIKEKIDENKVVGFITLGDASTYSTYGYLVEALRGQVTIETVPGVTSFCAAAALNNQPLVKKDEILTILPMNASDERIDRAIAQSDAVVMMKIYHREERVLQHLKKHQLLEQGILGLRCGFRDEIIHENLEEQLYQNKEYLSIILSRKESV